MQRRRMKKMGVRWAEGERERQSWRRGLGNVDNGEEGGGRQRERERKKMMHLTHTRNQGKGRGEEKKKRDGEGRSRNVSVLFETFLYAF